MIFSERQLAVAESELKKLKDARAEKTTQTDTANAWISEIEADALDSQIADIEVEIQEYQMIRDRQISFSERYSLSDLPRILIQARIAQGLSQSDLASRLNMKPQQIQRYEASDYMGASLSRLIEIADELDVRMTESFSTPTESVGSILAWQELDDVAWDRFPGEEMVRRSWFAPELGQSIGDAVRSFFERVAGPSFATALHRKKLRGKNLPDEAALLAWQARILQLAELRLAEVEIQPFDHSEAWVRELVELTKKDDGPELVRKCVERHGVLLIIEPHLPGSYLDGAAMLSREGHPIIAMTLRFNRLDNFWFVLFHELGHVFRHLFENTHLDFFDEEGPIGDDHLENEANEFALNSLIPSREWEKCLSRFAITEETVRADADRLGVHASIIAGRIRQECNDYTLLTNLVGQGEVHRYFPEVTK